MPPMASVQGHDGASEGNAPTTEVLAATNDEGCLSFLSQGRSYWSSHNLARKIIDRARILPRPGTQAIAQRAFYANVHPNHCEYEIDDDPTVAIRKFSLCGQYLVTFSRSPGVHFVMVYRLKSGFRQTKELPTGLWQHFFDLHFSTAISQGSEMLNKDFCLFTSDSRYLMVASTVAVTDPLPEESEIQENYSTIRNLENITLYVVDMDTGELCDQKRFEHDFISLAHNAGIHLRGNLLAVLSSYRQTIHLFQIRHGGQLHLLQSIGENCFPDDQLYLSQTRQETVRRAEPVEIAAPVSLSAILERTVPPPVEEIPQTDEFIGGIKHRILSYLWRRAKTSENSASAVLYFHRHFDEYNALCILKMQLIDEKHLLLKYGSRDHVGSRSQDSMGLYHAFFFVYNFITTEVINMFENNSEEFLTTYLQCAEYFFEERDTKFPFMLPLPSNSFYAREALRKQNYTARTARNGGVDQSIRRSLGELPIAPQNYRESPYFDLALYSYDEKLISHAERLKHCSEFPVKFYSRAHGGVVFKIPTGLREPIRGQKKLASFLFHPYLPFAITIQHVIHNSGATSSHTNFHLRK